MRDDADSRLAEIFRRLFVIRTEIDPGSFDRVLQDLLQALGAAAHREAEARARLLAARATRPGGAVAVPPFAARGRPDPWFDDHGT